MKIKYVTYFDNEKIESLLTIKDARTTIARLAVYAVANGNKNWSKDSKGALIELDDFMNRVKSHRCGIELNGLTHYFEPFAISNKKAVEAYSVTDITKTVKSNTLAIA